jgi:hypothetical protein
MSLADIVEILGELDDELLMYVERVSTVGPSSKVVLAYEPDDGSTPVEAQGMKYFLGIRTAKEVLAVWQRWRGDRIPSTKEKCEAIKFYAVYDAYLPVEDDGSER